MLQKILETLDSGTLAKIDSCWDLHGRYDQLPPSRASNGAEWLQWLILGGRGAGKTRAGAEWVRGVALGLNGFALQPASRIALVGETMADVRDVMIEGVSGILQTHGRWERPLCDATERMATKGEGGISRD